MADCPITTDVVVQDLSVTTQSVTHEDSGITANVVISALEISAQAVAEVPEVINVTSVVEDLSIDQSIVLEDDPILASVVVEDLSVETASIVRETDPLLANVIVSGGPGPPGPPGPGLWMHLVSSWTESPVLNPTPPVLGGEVYDYVYGPTTYYRHIPDPYDSLGDTFYESYSAGVLAGTIVPRGEAIAP